MIRQLHDQGLSVAAIARRLELDRKTIRKALRQAKPPETRKPRTYASLLDPFKDHVRARLQEYDLSAVRLLDELRAKGYEGGYSILKDYVSKVKDRQAVKAVVRFETKPGGQGQVDWADFGKITIDGVERKLTLFVMVLGWSRMRYAEYTLDAATPTLLQCHLNAFAYFGGYPRELLFDNMKQVVLERGATSDKHHWNPMFLDFAKHHGFLPRLCQPYRARTKGKVENSVKFVRYNFFEGRTFASLQDLNAQALTWCNTVGAHVHGTTHEVPLVRLPLEGLQSLDDKPPYIVTLSVERKISRECFVSYQGNRYSVPWRHAGREAVLRVRQARLHVEVAGQTIAEHDLLVAGNQVVRVKDHFHGLLVTTRPRAPQASRVVEFESDVVVERRGLQEYERVLDSYAEVQP